MKTHDSRQDGDGFTRRRFLGVLGAEAAGAAALGALGAVGLGSFEGTTALADPSSPASTSPLFFGRIFPNLPAFAPPSDALTAALRDIGKVGGYLDAADNLAAGPVLLITDPSLSANNPNNPTHTAGTTFMGQFMDHDITFDIGSPMGIPTDPESATNGRTPTFDLDSVYGFGPTGSPQLYGQDGDPVKLKIESGGLHED